MNEHHELSPHAISNAEIKMAEDLNAKAIYGIYSQRIHSKIAFKT